MQSSHTLDWYQISKLNNEYFSLDTFAQIVTKAEPSIDIDRVTMHYRKKLLILFQSAARIIKEQTPEAAVRNSDLQIKKSIVSDNLQQMEDSVEESFQEITNLKLKLAEKKRFMAKLREKLKTKGLAQTQKVYCCTLCNR